jgi:hypothetical protein
MVYSYNYCFLDIIHCPISYLKPTMFCLCPQVNPETGTSSIDWSQVSMLLHGETDLNKNRTTDNVKNTISVSKYKSKCQF